MSLRDQLVKAGLRSKKDAKKAANKLKVEKKKKRKAQKKGEEFTTEAEQLAADIAAKQQQQLERDKQLNADIRAEQESAEKRIRAGEIIYSNAVFEKRPDNSYYFVEQIEERRFVRMVRTTEKQVNQLAKGLLGIVKEELGSDRFKILPAADCARVQELMPELIICLHPAGETVGEEAQPTPEPQKQPEPGPQPAKQQAPQPEEQAKPEESKQP